MIFHITLFTRRALNPVPNKKKKKVVTQYPITLVKYYKIA